MDIRARFEQAVAESKSLSEKPNNATLLQLYALYRQGTEGDIRGEAPADSTDFVNMAKYEAWAAMRGKSREDAMQEYTDLVERHKG